MQMNTEKLLKVIADAKKRVDVCSSYAAGILLNAAYGGPVDWGQVNAAIIHKWSKAGLEFIKQRAWAMVEVKQS